MALEAWRQDEVAENDDGVVEVVAVASADADVSAVDCDVVVDVVSESVARDAWVGRLVKVEPGQQEVWLVPAAPVAWVSCARAPARYPLRLHQSRSRT